jgi:hypothetical protein
MPDRNTLQGFTDLEHTLFGWDAGRRDTSAQGFVRDALGPRRARVRFKTDRYPTVPLGPDTLRACNS